LLALEAMAVLTVVFQLPGVLVVIQPLETNSMHMVEVEVEAVHLLSPSQEVVEVVEYWGQEAMVRITLSGKAEHHR